MGKVRILFVCMGNICRSPTAHGVMEQLLANHALDHIVEVDSAGTHAYHVGNPPDSRSQSAASKRGYDLSAQRARQVERSDFKEFDYILAMDEDNLMHLEMICPRDKREKVSLFLEFAPKLKTREVPDPYYGGEKGFEHVLDLVEAAAEGLLEDIRNKHL